MNDQEQTLILLGRQLLPTDDIEKLSQRKAGYQAAVAARPPFVSSCPFTHVEDAVLREAMAVRPDIQNQLRELRGELVMVNLKQILAFQPLVGTDGLEERIEPVLADARKLGELCFPSQFSLEVNLSQ